MTNHLKANSYFQIIPYTSQIKVVYKNKQSMSIQLDNCGCQSHNGIKAASKEFDMCITFDYKNKENIQRQSEELI